MGFVCQEGGNSTKGEIACPGWIGGARLALAWLSFSQEHRTVSAEPVWSSVSQPHYLLAEGPICLL